jgi:hypothetical protein
MTIPAIYYGGLGTLGFKKQTVGGTPQPTVSQFFPVEGFILKQDHNLIENKASFGTLMGLPPLQGKLTPNGKATAWLAGAIPHPFYWALGGYSKTGAGPYTHTIIPDPNGVLPYLTVEGDEKAIKMKQSDVLLNKLSLACAFGEAVKITMEWLGLVHTDSATLTSVPAYPALTDLLTFLGATVSIGGSQVVDVQNITLDIDNGLEAQFSFGQRLPAVLARKGDLKLSGKFTFIDFPTAMYNNLISATTFNVTLNFAAGANTLQIVMPACAFTKGFDKEIKDEMVTADAEFGVYKDPASANSITVTAVNSVADLSV